MAQHYLPGMVARLKAMSGHSGAGAGR